MNAAPAPGGLRPRCVVHLRTLWTLHGFLLRLFTPWGGGLSFLKVSSGVFSAEPGDEVGIDLYAHEAENGIPGMIEYEIWRLRRPD